MGLQAIETHSLTKVFPGGAAAVAGAELAIPPGRAYGLIGRNGAGKTTLIRMLMGILRPTGGRAEVLGCDMWAADEAHRARVTYVCQEMHLPLRLTSRRLSDYCRAVYPRWDTAYADRLAARFEIDADQRVGTMSGGQQRKVAVLLSFAARPEVILLDEPAAGLDAIARRQLIDEIVDTLTGDGDCTVLLSTHIISDLERIAETVGIMDAGRIVTEASLDDLRARTQRVQVVFDAPATPDDFAVPGALRTRTEGGVVTAIVNVESDTQLDDLRRREDARVTVFPLGLEEIFVELFDRSTAGDRREGQP